MRTDAVAAGARGFLLKDADPATVLESVRAVHRGEAVIDSQAAPALLTAFREATPPARAEAARRRVEEALTARELEVLTLIGRGRANGEIAAELFIAETTVKTHVTHILQKMQLRDRVQAVVVAHEARLFEP